MKPARPLSARQAQAVVLATESKVDTEGICAGAAAEGRDLRGSSATREPLRG